MVSAESVRQFMGERTLALAGASRSGQKMGNAILKELKRKGYTVYPVHPEAQQIGDDRCYASFADLPEQVGGVVVVVKPTDAVRVVREAKEAGIGRVWLQQGAESPEVVSYCEQEAVDLISGECILMFAEPVESIHRFHRFVRRIFGRMPREETA